MTPSGSWRQAHVLALTETVSWGILYYAFVALLVPMRDDLGWSEGQLTFAYSMGILVSGLAAPLVGMWIDRHGTRGLMIGGSIGATLLVFAWSRVDAVWVFVLIWLGLGLMMSGTLYEPAFAAIARWFTHDRARPLLVVTICAGFASTIFLPLTTWLTGQVGWRHTVEIHALLLLGLTVVPHILFLRRPPPLPTSSTPPVGAAGAGSGMRQAIRSRPFILMTTAFGIQALAATAVAAFLIAYLVERGDSAGFAATATGAIGAAQVVSRILTTLFGKRFPASMLAAVMLAMQAGAVVILLLWQERPGVVLSVLLLGAGRGAMTLLRPDILIDTVGLRIFASMSGVQSSVMSVCGAIAPVSVGIAYGVLDDYRPIMWLMACLSSLAAAIMMASALHVSSFRRARATRITRL